MKDNTMEAVRLEDREKERMLAFTAQVFGNADKSSDDREILLGYNEALAMFLVAASQRAGK